MSKHTTKEPNITFIVFTKTLYYVCMTHNKLHIITSLSQTIAAHRSQNVIKGKLINKYP